MTISRVLLLLTFPALLGSCTAATSLPYVQESVSTKMAQAEVTHPATVKPKTKASMSKQPAPKQKAAKTSPPSDDGPTSQTTPNVGSPEWKKEEAQNERKEENLKRIIQGICRGC